MTSQDSSQSSSHPITLPIEEIDEIEFIVNVNNIIGNIGPVNFHYILNIVSQALFKLQSEKLMCNVINITAVSNKLLAPKFVINRAQTICLLYYLQQTSGIVIIDDTSDIPTWSIRDDVFKGMSS